MSDLKTKPPILIYENPLCSQLPVV